MSVCAAQFEYELTSAIEKYRRELGRIATKHAAEGQFHSGATLLKYQQASYAILEEFPDALLPVLTAFPNKHSPVRQADFDLARETVRSLRGSIEAAYAEKAKLVKGSESGSYLSNAKLDQLVRFANSKISAAEEYCLSERSFWKWAFGDLQKQLWTLMVTSITATLSGLAGLMIGRLI